MAEEGPTVAEEGQDGTGSGASETEDGDDGTKDADALVAWGLASFHAALLLVVPLALAHAVAPNAVGGLLAGLDTLVGVALYLVLWGSTWWSNRRYLAATTFDDRVNTLKTGARWGAVTGLPLLVVVVLAALVVINPIFAALLLVVGTVVALLVGAVIGATLAGFDLLLDRLAGALLSSR